MQTYVIDEKIRRLMLKIWNEETGETECLTLTSALHYLDCHFPKEKIAPALDWLIANKIVGKKFLEYLAYECSNSYLELHARLLARVERLAENSRKFKAGVDFR